MRIVDASKWFSSCMKNKKLLSIVIVLLTKSHFYTDFLKKLFDNSKTILATFAKSLMAQESESWKLTSLFLNAYSNSHHITRPFSISREMAFHCISESTRFIRLSDQNVLHFLKRKNTPILIFHNFSHRPPMPQSLVSSSIRLRFACRMFVVARRLLWGKSRWWSKLWKNIRIGEVFFFLKNSELYGRTFIINWVLTQKCIEKAFSLKNWKSKWLGDVIWYEFEYAFKKSDVNFKELDSSAQNLSSLRKLSNHFYRY